jgi:hypothetical protein
VLCCLVGRKDCMRQVLALVCFLREKDTLKSRSNQGRTPPSGVYHPPPHPLYREVQHHPMENLHPSLQMRLDLLLDHANLLIERVGTKL